MLFICVFSLIFFFFLFFFFNDTATTEIYTLSLHDALPVYRASVRRRAAPTPTPGASPCPLVVVIAHHLPQPVRWLGQIKSAFDDQRGRAEMWRCLPVPYRDTGQPRSPGLPQAAGRELRQERRAVGQHGVVEGRQGRVVGRGGGRVAGAAGAQEDIGSGHLREDPGEVLGAGQRGGQLGEPLLTEHLPGRRRDEVVLGRVVDRQRVLLLVAHFGAQAMRGRDVLAQGDGPLAYL